MWRVGRSARKCILENFAVAADYNMISIPVAFVGFATPLVAAIAMSISSIVVSINALRTRWAMEVLAILIPGSIGLGIVGLLAFFWTMKNRQYQDRPR